MNVKGHGHSLTFIQGHSDSTFSNFFCSEEAARPIEAKFHMAPPWDMGNENLFKCSRSHDHAHIQCMVKNLKNLLLRKQEADDLETWYTTSGTRLLPMFSYDDPRLTLTIFMTGSNLFPNASACVKAYTALSANVVPSLF